MTNVDLSPTRVRRAALAGLLAAALRVGAAVVATSPATAALKYKQPACGKVGTSGWRIVDAKVSKDGRNFTAVVEAWIPGGKHVQGIIRNGDAWQVGYEFSGKINSPGPVEKRDARAACAAL